jgi:outer membrane protein TolC
MGNGFRILIFTLVTASAAWGAEAPLVPGASVQDLLQYLEQDSAELAAARHEAAGARERADAAGALPDPSVRIDWWDISRNNPTLDPRMNGQTMYNFLQPIPGWGKRDAQKRAAEADAVTAREQQRALSAELRAQVKTAFVEYYRNHHALQLNQELGAFSDSVAQLAKSRYETGLASQQEMIRAQLEQSSLQTERYELEAAYSQSQARINALLNRAPDAELRAPEALRPLPSPAVLDESALEQRVRDASPQLAAQKAQVDAAQSSVDLVRKNLTPDFVLGIAPVQRGNSFSTWNAMLEFTVPLHHEAHHAHQHEADEMLEASQARRQAAEVRLMSELRQRYAALKAAQQQGALLLQRALPLAELAFQSALAGYQNGAVDFATLLEAKRQVQRAKLDALNAEAVQQINLAEIERLIGEDL